MELIAFGLVFAYFLPSLIRGIRRKNNLGAIFTLNLLLGWTFIGMGRLNGLGDMQQTAERFRKTRDETETSTAHSWSR